MPYVTAGRVKETTTTTGTGAYSLAGAVAGFRTFVVGVGSGNTCGYNVDDGLNYEYGIGTVVDSTPDLLSRDEIIASSNSGAAVNWGAGAKNVICTPIPEIDYPSTRKLTVDPAASTVTTMADVTGLSFPVLANKYYRFRFELIYRSAATTTGIKLSVTIPAFTRFTAEGAGHSVTADGVASKFVGFITASDDPVICSGVQVINTDYMAVIKGLLVPSASGNLTARFASEVAASAVTVRQGSIGLLWRIP
jgi:hypothetical protein